jgi:serine/threonine protein kinase
MIGKLVLNYELKSIIGEGGMGSVYLAEHTQVKRKVAIKVLRPQFTKNEEIKARFKNEASTMAHLHHPNIVSLFDYLEDESGMYLIMEYVEGKPLDEYINTVTGPMPEAKAIPIMEQVLSAFDYAHDQGVVHRDIKPANIIVGNDGRVKILDFGIARLLGEQGQHMTKTGTQMGTVFYMSPEQVQGKKADNRSDIYSLGVTFYQMLTGINPYQGITTEYEVYNKIVKEDLPNPKEIYPGVPDYLTSILRKALQKEPTDRFQRCSEFLDAIKSKATVQPASKSVGTNQAKSAHNPEPTNIRYTPPKPKRSAVRIILLLVVACALIGVGVFAFMEQNKDTDGDGVIDRKDKCITEFGRFKGCPDQDRDGVLDSEDACPYEKGSKAHNGCPDKDGDSVFDDKDECDDEAGDPNNSGCPWPDGDEDGVPDKDDDCPSEYGPSSNSGCPIVEEYYEEDSGYDGYYESEPSTYYTKCPYCGNESYETRKDIRWTCGRSTCRKTFYGCRKKNTNQYGIPLAWLDDGECDCADDCSDE